MPFIISDQNLNEELERLASRQPVPTSKTELARAILQACCERFASTDDPLGWQETTESSSAEK